MSLPHSEKLTLPFVAVLTTHTVWKIEMTQSSDPEFSFTNLKPRSWGTRPAVDTFEVCSEFLALQTPEETLRFFDRYGPFQLEPHQEGADPKPLTALPIRWSGIQKAQSDFKAARMSASIDLSVINLERDNKKPPDWRYKNPVHAFVFQPLRGIELNFRGPEEFRLKLGYSKDDDPEDPSPSTVLSPKPGSPPLLSDAAIVNCSDVVTAVRASIFLRRMNGFTWRRCERKDCDKVFEVSVGQAKKKFHNWACGHLVAVRKSKAKKKKEEKEAKFKKTKSKTKGRK
jgi:hypothetical protein